MNNYYEILAVNKTATKEEIKKAYLIMLKQYHPDVFKGNKQIAQDFTAKLNLAFETLSNSLSRLAYDKSIFPAQFVNYIYDEKGVKVFQKFKKKNEKKCLPVFSFFKKNKVSEKFSKVKKSLKNKKQKNKKQKNKKQKNKKQKKDNKVKASFEEKINKKFSKENLYQKNKRNLNLSIIIIASVLILFFGFMIYLNLIYN